MLFVCEGSQHSWRLHADYVHLMKYSTMVSEHLKVSRKFSNESEGGLQLDRWVSRLRNHLLLIVSVTAVFSSVAIIRALTERPVYQSEFELLTPPETVETQILSAINSSTIGNQSESVGIGSLDETELKILTSPRVVMPAVEELQEIYPSLTYQELVRNLDIIPNDEGKTLTVQYGDTNPEKVLDILDILSKTFLRYSLDDRQDDIQMGLNFIDKQVPIARARVNELELDLEKLSQESNLIDPVLQAQQLTQQKAEFSSTQLNLRVQIKQSENLYVDLVQALDQSGELAATSILLQNERYQSLLDQLAEVDSQLAAYLSLYMDDSPEIALIESHRSNLEPLLAREGFRVQEQLASYIQELRDHDQTLSDLIGTLDGEIKSLSTFSRQFNSIQRDLEIAAVNLNQLLTKREALRIDAAQRQTPWEILTPPGAAQASSLSIMPQLLLGSILGALIGSAIAIIVDRMRNKIHTIKDLKEAIRVPILGNIPHNQLLEDGLSLILSGKDFSKSVVAMEGEAHSKERSTGPILDAFKRLVTNIKLDSSGNQIKSLTVSSTILNEGKSSISFYLAYSSAILGYRTLLVDTDLRHPTLHNLCHVSNEKGISSHVLEETPLTESLINLPIEDNLFFLPAGPVPEEPAKVLSSKRLEAFCQQVYEEFDLVIFDTPPLLGLADAFMVVTKTQGLLLTCRLGHLDFTQLQSALDELYITEIPIIGIVANDVEKDSQKPYNYYDRLVKEKANEPSEYNGNVSSGKAIS